MKLFFKGKDGGSDSNVTGYWLIEAKNLFSIVLLCFDKGSREAYHSHAFNAVSWVLKGELLEHIYLCNGYGFQERMYPSIFPVKTSRNRFHKVYGKADKTWVLSFRGPWNEAWEEYLPNEDKRITLTHGRKIV